MWRRAVVGKEHIPVVIWQKNGITEVYDVNALHANIVNCEDRINNDVNLDDFNKSALEQSIDHLKQGLSLL